MRIPSAKLIIPRLPISSYCSKALLLVLVLLAVNIFDLKTMKLVNTMCASAETVDNQSGKNKMNKQVKTKKAIFGAGCFWGVQENFSHLPGVISTTVGFSGGTVKEPSYERVCQGNTGHAEVVEVDYDPSKISYKDLLKTFFSSHDPTTMNRQGPDIGYQYRSVIFYSSPEQEKEAIAAKDELQTHSRSPIVTAIEPAEPFYKAEEYHQHYLEKRGLNVCH